MPDSAKDELSHGGELTQAEARFGAPARGWLDLSTGINPRGYPVPPVDAELWRRLPLKEEEDGAVAAARARYRVRADAAVVATPGAQAAIQWLPRLRPPSMVGIVGPTYEEHVQCWSAAGHDVRILADLPDPSEPFDVVVAVNPNNPDGRVWPHATLDRLAADMARKGGLLVVDEAFADQDEAVGWTPRCGPGGAVTLRSLGKMYGLAGVRVGFVVGDVRVVESMRRVLGPWSCGGPALTIAETALRDEAYLIQTVAWLDTSVSRLDRLLLDSGLSFVGGCRLFRLFARESAHALHGRLARAGVLVRSFPYRTDWLRFGVPPDEQGFERFAGALRAACATRD